MIDHDLFIKRFTTYVERWQQLAREFSTIPGWRIIKQLQNIRQREKLTKQFTKEMEEMGVIK